MDRRPARLSSTASDTGARPRRGIERAAPGEVRVRRALLSVSDKAGIVDFARGLAELGVEIVSTGGTARELERGGHRRARDRGLHRLPRDHGRAREDAAPAAVRGPAGAARRRVAPAGRRRAGDRAGGSRVREPVPVRADPRPRRRLRGGDRREHRHRRPHDDPRRRQEQRLRGRRRRPAPTTRACSRSCASPDGRAVAAGHARATLAAPRRSPAPPATTPRSRPGSPRAPTRASRRRWRDAYEKVSDLRYGENPHQRAAFYARAARPRTCSQGVSQLHGKELSFNNLLDLSSARELVEDFAGPACAIVKHNNPCGCALGGAPPGGLRARLRLRPHERLRRRDRAQPAGGPRLRARRSAEQFIEVLLAPGFDARRA